MDFLLRVTLGHDRRHNSDELFEVNGLADVARHFLEVANDVGLLEVLEAKCFHGSLELTRIDRARMVGVEQLEGFLQFLQLLIVDHFAVTRCNFSDVVDEGLALGRLSDVG